MENRDFGLCKTTDPPLPKPHAGAWRGRGSPPFFCEENPFPSRQVLHGDPPAPSPFHEGEFLPAGSYGKWLRMSEMGLSPAPGGVVLSGQVLHPSPASQPEPRK